MVFEGLMFVIVLVFGGVCLLLSCVCLGYACWGVVFVGGVVFWSFYDGFAYRPLKKYLER